MSEVENITEEESKSKDLTPKKPPRLAPEGIRTFTVAREYDETGISGEGVVIEGVTLATGPVHSPLAIPATPGLHCHL